MTSMTSTTGLHFAARLFRPAKHCALVLPCFLLIACSGTGPKPDGASGEVRQANTQQQALEELIEITRAGQPKRFRAERAGDVRQTLQSWAKTSGMTLQWKSAQSLSTTGVIDELNIHSAVLSLAQQFPSDQAAVMVQFPTPRLMIVSDVLSKDQSTQNCPQVPAGAIVIGRYCLLAEQFWFVDPSDKFLSATLERWASAAQLDLNWKSKLDWPITLTVRKPYSGDLLSAISAVTNDLAAQGVDFRYAISGKTLSINASPRPQTSPQTPAPSQAKETTK
ncbi:TcpQ domain-containing protein [Limnohabitans lacus]|nr:TcpQ domain-containing protein [Limnohabitans sp. HM2-2]